ncbi:MAG: Vms1/Ankzf1 family peptidyl-tRNA hydrolase [Candidatus Gastranaerophilaceae bacterium]|jgi:peptide chain release factor subunit 1
MRHVEKIQSRIKSLSSIENNNFPFITLYMNVNATHFLEQKEQNRIFLKNAYNKALKNIQNEFSKENLESLKNDFEKINDYLNEKLNTTIHGIAFFVCEELGIFEIFESFISFENEFVVDLFPHLKQLLYVYDEYEKTLAVLLDSKHAEIFEIKLGGYISQKGELKAELESDVYKFHKQGGWSQLRYQRGIQQEKDWHYRETALKTTEIFDTESYDNVIIVGIDFEVDNFIKYLPKRVVDKLIDTENYTPEENINTLLEKIINDLYKKEKAKEYDIVQNMIQKASSKDGACLGFDETIDLASQGRLDTLIVTKETSKMGFRSGECLYTARGQKKPGCPECNGESKDTDLIEELVRLTVKNGGRVELLNKETPSGQKMEEYGGIGGILRY